MSHPVWLKMDSLQPSGSFKQRGLGHMCRKAAEEGCGLFVSSSGGNAGVAIAYAGKELGIPTTVVVPSTTQPLMRERIASYGATVVVEGDVWDQADQYARALVENQGGKYIPPFDHPDVWEGNSSLIHEAKLQLPVKPHSVVVACGGGGLFVGIRQGLEAVGWGDVPVLAVETEGASSLTTSVQEGKLVTLPGITSIATSLGARTVAAEAFHLAKLPNSYQQVVTDADAVGACLQFADDHRTLVEPACGAALSSVYGGPGVFAASGMPLPTEGDGPILLVVCGGGGVTLDLLERWKRQFDLDTKLNSL